MPLADFSVVYEAGDHDGTLIHCLDGRELVLGLVDRTSLDDYFRWPKAGRDDGRVSLSDCHLVVDRNLAVITPIIEAKYQHGEFEILHRLGSSLKLVRVTGVDLQRANSPLSDSVLDMARATRFFGT